MSAAKNTVLRWPTAIACPSCRYEFDLLTTMEEEGNHHALKALLNAALPTLGARLMRYIQLFRTPKHRLTFAKEMTLLGQIVPEIQERRVHWKGRELPAQPKDWGAAIDHMLEAAQAGRLELPIKSHGYLRSIVVGLADKAEAAAAAAERQLEADKRTGPQRDVVQVRGQTLPIGEALQVAYAGKDPALAKLDADARAAAPMPDSVREHLANLKRRPAQ